MKLVLGSASPRRKEILSALGYSFTQVVPSVDESPKAGEAWGAYLERIVQSKFDAVERLAGDAVVLVADTSVIADDRILGKPESDAEGLAMLRTLAGATHLVATRFCVGRREEKFANTVITEVEMRALSDEEIAAYVATGEGRDKAGGYAIQGGAAVFVRALHGSYTNVVGLPACEVNDALSSFRKRARG